MESSPSSTSRQRSIAVISAARAVGGADLKLVVLGTVNDVALFRNLLSAGASDYLVKPSRSPVLTVGGCSQTGPRPFPTQRLGLRGSAADKRAKQLSWDCPTGST